MNMACVFLQEWICTNILVVCWLVHSLNAAAGLQTYSIVTFASYSVEKQLTGDFKSQLMFKSVGNNGMFDICIICFFYLVLLKLMIFSDCLASLRGVY